MALKNDPGFLASSALHGAALALLLFNFSSAPKFEDVEESVPVEMITPSELNKISAGEKTAKPLSAPRRHVEKLAAVTETKPLPVPPTPEAETIEPKPVPRPRIEPRKEAKAEPSKPEPKPPQKPIDKKPVVKEAKAPEPPKKVEKSEKVERSERSERSDKSEKAERSEKAEKSDKSEKSEKPAPHLKLDELASLLADPKATKPAAKPKAGNEAREATHRDFDPRSISALLDREAPRHKAATGQKLTQVAALGAPEAHAATLSPSMLAQLDQVLIDQ
jgi:colicin import membrane protein